MNTLESIGKILKAKRQEAGLTIKEVALVLKLKSQSLEEIEQEKCDLGDVYVMGYMRIYAKYLGVNVDTNAIATAETNLLTDLPQEENFEERTGNVTNIPSLRVVVIAVFTVAFSVIGLVVLSKNNTIKNEIGYMNKLHTNYSDRVVITENSRTYVVQKHDIPMTIRANDSVEVKVLDSENNLLNKLNLRIGEVVPFPMHSKSTIVYTDLPNSIEIEKKE
jgi:transcriptional regulator with XRE-family HTH domain